MQSNGFVWDGEVGDGGWWCREGTQHLSALRHNLQMAAMSGEASALEPVTRHSNRGGETGWQTQIQMDREMDGEEDKLTECETQRQKREGTWVVLRIWRVNLDELFFYFIFYMPLWDTAHFLSMGVNNYTIKWYWYWYLDKRHEFPSKSINSCQCKVFWIKAASKWHMLLCYLFMITIKNSLFQ